MRHFTALVVLSLTLTGCAATLHESGSQEVAWSSMSSKPGWVTDGTPYFRKNHNLYFVGISVDSKDQQNARLHAKAEAIRTMTDGVRLLTKSWLTDTLHGNDDMAQGQFLKAGVAAVSSVVDVSGLMPTSEYAEKIRTWDGTGWKYNWTLYGLYELPEVEYVSARRRAMEGLIVKAKSENNQKAEAMAEDALKKLDVMTTP